MNHNPTLGILMLTRNSQENLPNALNSASEFVKQIVVVDTGSTDDTVSVAAHLGAEVYFFKWIDDFSAARNFAIRHIHTDWILMLDSDELLNSFDSDLFNKYASNPMIGGINILISNRLNQGANETITSHRYTRIFRNHPQIRFEGRIHEQIRGSIENSGLIIQESDFSIHHLGYSSFNEEKNQRNLKLLNSDAMDNPDDDWLKFHIAETHFAAGRSDESAEIYMKIIQSNQLSTVQSEVVRLRLAQISLKHDNYDVVLKLTDFISNNFQNEALRNYVRGTALLFLKDYLKAIECYEMCLEIDSPSIIKNDVQNALDFAKRMI